MVMRDRRSWTRRSIGALASLYSGLAALVVFVEFNKDADATVATRMASNGIRNIVYEAVDSDRKAVLGKYGPGILQH